MRKYCHTFLPDSGKFKSKVYMGTSYEKIPTMDLLFMVARRLLVSVSVCFKYTACWVHKRARKMYAKNETLIFVLI